MAGKIKRTVASFDTSTTSSGYAAFTMDEDSYSFIDSGVIKQKNKDVDLRVNDMIASILYKLNEYHPEIVVVEKPPYKNDPSTLIYLSEIVGAIRGWCLYNGSDYAEYSPSRWRKFVKADEETVPKNRELCKPWAIAKVKKMFGFSVSDDEAEAILIGVARIKALLSPEEEKPPKRRTKKSSKKEK